MTYHDPTDRRLQIALLMGGASSEREISLLTGGMILKALDTERYLVRVVDTRDLLPGPEAPGLETAVIRDDGPLGAIPTARSAMPGAGGHSLLNPRPDLVFIALHGKGGEDGSIQGLLEVLGLPYTGSGVLASALAMDKAMSKRLFRCSGIPVPADVLIRRGETVESDLIARVQNELGASPVFVKPNAEGSTFGCALVTDFTRLPEAVANALRYDASALIEPYIRGAEITVGVLGNTGDVDLQALPVIEIIPKSEYFDFESKYTEGGSEHIIPARLPGTLLAQAQEIALRCHTLLGCRGMSRTDMIVSGDRLFVLEVNTIPGMTPTSLLPQAAEHAGILFPALLDRIIDSAL